MIVLDIEAIPHQQIPYPTPDSIKVPGNIKLPESIHKYKHNPENLEAVHRSRATSPIQCQPVCVGFSMFEVMDGQPTEGFLQVHMVSHPHNEARLIQDIDDWIMAHDPEFNHAMVAYNGLHYDFKALSWAAMRHSNYALARRCNPGKWGDPRHIDPAAWAPRFTSFKVICESLGVYHQSAGQGSEVYDNWLSGRHSTNEAHCADDVRALSMVTLSMVRAGILNPER